MNSNDSEASPNSGSGEVELQFTPREAQAENERSKARRQRRFGARQRRLATFDKPPIGTIRRQAAVLHDSAALVHERTADRLESYVRRLRRRR